MEHIIIQRDDSTYDDWRNLPVVVRCSERRGAPYGKVHSGDIVYVLVSGKGIVSRARVAGARSFEYNGINSVRELCRGTKLYDGMDYWRSVAGRRYATVVHLTDNATLDPAVVPQKRSYGSSWIVLDTPDKRKAWLGAS